MVCETSSKKRSRRVLDRDTAARFNPQNSSPAIMNRPNRNMLSAAILTLATLVITVDTTAVVAFTPTTGGSAPLSTGPVSSSIIDSSSKDVVALKISPLSTTRRRQRRQTGPFSSTVVDDDSTSTTTNMIEANGQSSILNQQRNARFSPHSTQNVVVLDEEYFRGEKSNDMAVQVLFNSDIVTSPIQNRASTRVASTDSNRKPKPQKIVRPKRRTSFSRKITPSKSDTKTKSKSNLDSTSSSLLTRDEERQITYKIRNLRRVVSIRDELIEENESCSPFEPSFAGDNDCYPTEAEWAKACGLDVPSLRSVMTEGQDARALLVSANAGLVKHIAKRHYYVLKRMTTAGGGVGTILTLQDMIQEGNLGLMKAAERFEPERGFRFSTYATYWIRQRILQSITDSSRVIRLPVHGTSSRMSWSMELVLFSSFILTDIFPLVFIETPQ